MAHALNEKWSLLQSSRRNLEELEQTVSLRAAELQASEQRFRHIELVRAGGHFELDAVGSVIYTNPLVRRLAAAALSS